MDVARDSLIATESTTEEELKSILDRRNSHNSATAEQIYIRSVQGMLEKPPFSYKQRLSERISRKMVVDGHMIFANATPVVDEEGHETDSLNDKADEYKHLCNEKIMVIQATRSTMDAHALKSLMEMHPKIQEEGLHTTTSDNITDNILEEITGFLEVQCKFAKRAVIMFQGDQMKDSDAETAMEFTKSLFESISSVFPLEIEVVFRDEAGTLTFIFSSRDGRQIQCMKMMPSIPDHVNPAEVDQSNTPVVYAF